MDSVHDHENAVNPFDDKDDTTYNPFTIDEVTQGDVRRPPLSGPGTPAPSSSHTRVYHPNQSGQQQPGGLNHIGLMDRDIHRELREENIYYPFASESEWELARWLSSGMLSQKDINQYLRLQRVCKLYLAFVHALMFLVDLGSSSFI